MPKQHDVLVYGATGYTGRLVVEYLARHADSGLRWAIGGRDSAKLKQVSAAVGLELPTFVARSEDRASLRAMSDSASVVVSCAGPFGSFGEPLVAACVDTKTDYVDITGEPDFVRDIVERHHARAAEAGVRVVPCCGFDSVPSDLGVFFTMDALRPQASVAAESFVHINWDVSGGTWQTIISGMSRGRSTAEVPREPEAGRKVRGRPRPPRYEQDANGWIVPSPMIDPQIVLRSASMLDGYGPEFSYANYLRVGTLARTAAMGVGAAAVFGLAQLAPTRALLSKLRPSGAGASEEKRDSGFFRVTTVARAGGEKIVTRVSGGDKYVETAKIASEAAMCLIDARDRLPRRAGVLTPAVAMGKELTARLDNRGVRFEVIRRAKGG